MTKTTYDQVAAEAFTGDPTPRDEMEPWKRLSILIQSGINYAMVSEIERGVAIKRSQMAEGVAHGIAAIIYNTHSNGIEGIEGIDREAADSTVKYILAEVTTAVTQCLNNAAPETVVVGTRVSIDPQH